MLTNQNCLHLTVLIFQVGSRRVVQIGAICMIILGILGKFGALFSTIPNPVVGGIFCCMFGMITAVGISNLQYVDLNSVRNLFIIGFAFIMGFAVPDYFNKNPGAINTGKKPLLTIYDFHFVYRDCRVKYR